MCRVYQVPRVRLQVRAGYVVRINCFPPRAKHAARMLSRFQPSLHRTKLFSFVICFHKLIFKVEVEDILRPFIHL